MIWWKRPSLKPYGGNRLAIQLYDTALSEKPIIGLSEMYPQRVNITIDYWIAKMGETYFGRKPVQSSKNFVDLLPYLLTARQLEISPLIFLLGLNHLLRAEVIEVNECNDSITMSALRPE